VPTIQGGLRGSHASGVLLESDLSAPLSATAASGTGPGLGTPGAGLGASGGTLTLPGEGGMGWGGGGVGEGEGMRCDSHKRCLQQMELFTAACCSGSQLVLQLLHGTHGAAGLCLRLPVACGMFSGAV
jgi:hypothetical protein